MAISWAYLAGFVDGEGSIGVYRRSYETQEGTRFYHRANVRISQCETQAWVLIEIADFLNSHEITSCFSERKPWKEDGPRQNMFQLSVDDRYMVAKALKAMIPHLVVKKSKAEEVLNWIMENPKRTRPSADNFTKRQVTNMRRMYAAGYSQDEIARKYGTYQVRVSRLVRGIPV